MINYSIRNKYEDINVNKPTNYRKGVKNQLPDDVQWGLYRDGALTIAAIIGPII